MLTYFHFIYLFIYFPMIDIFFSALSEHPSQALSLTSILSSVKTGTTELWQAGFWGKDKVTLGS